MTTTETVSAIYSSLGADPDLGELVEMFVEEMPQRIATLESTFAEQDLAGLKRTAHQLKGACGSYGFSQLTPLAARLEAAVRDGESAEAIESALTELVGACRCVRAGTP
ncbi:MAG: Hpt domain-containing protein [Planctomycetales bacterium]|nr:Hpt domain-containing protein [Planctomycetales bacterium]